LGIPNFELIVERPRDLRALIVLYVLTEEPELGGEDLCESIWPSIPDFIELF
jgi:DNA-binding SARP family transcriptional activator